MNLLQPNTSQLISQLIKAFSWMLIHSLWQGLLMAIITVVCLLAARKASAALRYNIVLVNSTILIILSAATLVWELSKNMAYSNPGYPAQAIFTGSPYVTFYDISGIQNFSYSCTVYFSRNAPMLVLIWFIFFVFRLVKMVQGMAYLQKVKSSYIYEAPVFWQERARYLCKILQLNKTVSLFESGHVSIPMVIGHLKPVILIPAGLLTGLPAAQIEAILLHELAHIRRHDYAVNILQVIMESVFFFNPGLLWLSALLRDERENCCDDIALTQTQNKIEFVQALIGFKEHALKKMYPAVAFPGGKNQLVKRVSRILGHQSPAMAPVEKRSFITCVLIFCAFIATALVGNVKKANNKGFLKSRHVPVLLNYTSADMFRRSLNKTRSLQKYKQITDKRKIVDIALLKPGKQFKTFKAIHANIRTAVPSIINQFFAAPRLSPEQPADLEEEQNKKD
ncbi:MAG: M56 family metallopeptidase, partial [Sphingobacteriaceae bacterium]